MNFKYTFTINDICRLYSISETQLLEFVWIGRLLPQNWENMDEKQRKLAMANRTLLFTKDRLDVFFSNVLIENLRYYEILQSIDRLTQKIEELSCQVARVDEMFVQKNTQMSLMAFSKKTGYKISYLRKSIKKLTSNNDCGLLQIKGFNLPVIKIGKTWTMNYFDFIKQYRNISYEILKEFKVDECTVQ